MASVMVVQVRSRSGFSQVCKSSVRFQDRSPSNTVTDSPIAPPDKASRCAQGPLRQAEQACHRRHDDYRQAQRLRLGPVAHEQREGTPGQPEAEIAVQERPFQGVADGEEDAHDRPHENQR